MNKELIIDYLSLALETHIDVDSVRMDLNKLGGTYKGIRFGFNALQRTMHFIHDNIRYIVKDHQVTKEKMKGMFTEDKLQEFLIAYALNEYISSHEGTYIFSAYEYIDEHTMKLPKDIVGHEPVIKITEYDPPMVNGEVVCDREVFNKLVNEISINEDIEVLNTVCTIITEMKSDDENLINPEVLGILNNVGYHLDEVKFIKDRW